MIFAPEPIKVYPNGVTKSHLTYQAKMGRDKDGYACER
ncbi:excalibur calcium-binding domain-containing protein [Peribacillus sp. NPDC096622]